MLFSRALLTTVKEAPADAANASHLLLTRAGFIRRVGAGMYDFLPLGLRVLHKITRIVREEMDRSGALEVLMPALLPAEYYKESGRWDGFGDTLFRLKDRKGSDLHLGPTHEEIVTDIARREIRSYRDMPKNLYQIQTKFRDEPRPRGGLLRTREFLMKDAYSFDTTEQAALASFERMRVAYCRIFDRLGLMYRMVAADSGAMGGSMSAEFQALVESGEDAIVACDTCDYAANVEIATVQSSPSAQDIALEPTQRVHTPGQGTIDEVTAFLGIAPAQMPKSLLYVGEHGEIVMVVVRGDHAVNEVLLARALGVAEVSLATEADVKKATGAAVGFAGPTTFQGRIVVDRAASHVRNGVVGGNETDYHITGVNYGRDFTGDIVDVRLAATGDPCSRCEGGKLASYRGIEAGHIFVLGTHYSTKMGAMFSDERQESHPIWMGCYGIGVSRLVATVIEQHHDDNGMRWPNAIAPYDVYIVTVGKDAPVLEAARKLHDALEERGIEVLWDDRDERPGVKFKDADLIGIPWRVTLGAKALATGNVELKARSEPDPKKVELIPVASAVETLRARIRA